MTTLTATKAEYEVMPTNDYLVQITDIEETAGNYGPQFQFTLEVVKPERYAGKTRKYWCSQKLTAGSKKSKLWSLVEAAYNRPLEIGEAVDSDNLQGRRMIATIVVETGDDGSENNKIAAIKPYKKQEPWPKTEAGKRVATTDESDDDPFSDE